MIKIQNPLIWFYWRVESVVTVLGGGGWFVYDRKRRKLIGWLRIVIIEFFTVIIEVKKKELTRHKSHAWRIICPRKLPLRAIKRHFIHTVMYLTVRYSGSA